MTVGSFLKRAQEYLSRHHIPEASTNAEFLMASALNVGRGDIHFKRNLPMALRDRRRFWRWVLRRGRRVPLAYILGTQPFNGMELLVKPGVLIPRPETEELTEIALGLARRLIKGSRRRLKILDIGTGSGCLALAMARALPDAGVMAIDISRKAIAVAKTNAKNLGLSSRIKFYCTQRLKEGWKADLIVSNPPYVPSGRLNRLEPEVLREPRLALDGGPDGLRVIRQVIGHARACLKPEGWLALEMDAGQGNRVKQLLKTSGFRQVEIQRDFQGLERFAIAQFAQE